MNRRFSIITLKENTKEETFDILKETKSFYEKFHKIEIDDDVLRYLVENVDRYIKNRTFPDKAIDILIYHVLKQDLNSNTLLQTNCKRCYRRIYIN